MIGTIKALDVQLKDQKVKRKHWLTKVEYFAHDSKRIAS